MDEDEYMPPYGAGDYGAGGDVLLVKQFDTQYKPAMQLVLVTEAKTA